MIMNLYVLLDNGHGKEATNNCSPFTKYGKLYEWKFCRELVDLIITRKARFFNCGCSNSINVEFIVITPETTDISLGERVKRVNEMYNQFKTDTSEVIFISVHANAAGGNGFEAFTSKGETKADILSKHIYEAAERILPKQFKIRKGSLDCNDPDKDENFCVLKNTFPPAVLTENLFMDTESNYEFMCTEAGKIILADIHLMGIKNYLNELMYK